VTEPTVKEEGVVRRRRRRRSRIAKLFDGAVAWGKTGLRALAKLGLTVAGVVLVLLLVLAASIAYPSLRYAPPQFGAILPDGTMLADGGGSNVYILRTDRSSVLLVDCGRDPEMRGVAAALKRWGLGLDAVKLVLITHAHPDHIDGCAAVPGARLGALDKEVAAIEGRAIVPGPFAMLTFARSRPTGLEVARRLQDGDAFMAGDRMVTVYAVPGHTPGSAAYLIGSVLFAGDAVAFGRDGSVVEGPWIFNSDGGQMSASRRAVAKSLAGVVDTVATGHTAPGRIEAME
jgi:glyoxylase-like metal-dependent hydrolase (beta-lactamase superfamily II)